MAVPPSEIGEEMMTKKGQRKRIVSVELCDNRKGYKGRLLGLINDSEFYRVLNSKRTQNKIFSSETKPLSEIADYDDFNGLRLVVAVKEIDGEVIGGKHLFISERLNIVANVGVDHQVGILGSVDEYIIISEEVD